MISRSVTWEVTVVGTAPRKGDVIRYLYISLGGGIWPNAADSGSRAESFMGIFKDISKIRVKATTLRKLSHIFHRLIHV